MTATSLVEFLRARLDDEAALAERLAKRYVYPPDHDLAGQSYWPRPTVRGALRHTGDDDAAALIGAFNPHRVLAEVDAKRRMLPLLAEAVGTQTAFSWNCYVALLLLALPYAHHPDYREEWKP